MTMKSDLFLKKTVGDDFLESLVKFDLYKPGTRSVVDHNEVGTALQIVPRVLLSFLLQNLSSMASGENKKISLPCGDEAELDVTKHERDVYSGSILEKNKVVVDFKYRTIPGIGLIILSAFELYDVSALTAEAQGQVKPDVAGQVEKMIEERMALHSMIHAVVDKKLSERDAVKELVLARLTEKMKSPEPVLPITPQPFPQTPEPIDAPVITHDDIQNIDKKRPPVIAFMQKVESKKLKKSEFSIVMAKGETVNCPDCKKAIFNETKFSACVCFGDSKTVHLKKTAEGVKISFPKTWDPEDMKMLLEILWRKNGKSNGQ